MLISRCSYYYPTRFYQGRNSAVGILCVSSFHCTKVGEDAYGKLSRGSRELQNLWMASGGKQRRRARCYSVVSEKCCEPNTMLKTKYLCCWAVPLALCCYASVDTVVWRSLIIVVSGSIVGYNISCFGNYKYFFP